MNSDHPCILTVAGSDSGGGAGIQADLKTITVLGGYGLSVITALTAQNTQGVFGISSPEEQFVGLQLQTVLDDLPVKAAKTGMLFSVQIIKEVAMQLQGSSFPIVVDPVCVSQSGHTLLQDEATQALLEHIVPLATLITPNRPEAETLTSLTINTSQDAARAADIFHEKGAQAVLIKGGHFEGEAMQDWFFERGKEMVTLTRPRLATTNTHGTGCTLSAAIATYLGFGWSLYEAVTKARDYLQTALEQSYDLGKGQGPVNHLWPLEKVK